MPDSPANTATRPAAGRLLRILGVGFGIAVAIGTTISAGIVRTPGEIAARLPVAWLFVAVWVVGGLYALLGAFSLSELGAMIPREGGQYVFARRALGDYAGFIVGWGDWVSCSSSVALIAIVVGEYTGDLLPALQTHTVATSLALTLAIALLQWLGVRWGSRIQEITAVLKALGFLGLVVLFFVLGGKSPGQSHLALPAPHGLTLFLGLVLSMQAVIYAYDGWDSIVYFLEEVRDPAKEVPKAMIGSVLSILGIYLLLNLGLVYILPMENFAGNNFALGLAAQRIFGAHGDAVIRVLMIVSLISGVNACLLEASRVLFGMSRDRFFSRRAAAVNKGGTPGIALLLSTAVAVAFITTGSFAKVIAVTAFFFVANYTISFISLFVLRRREPEAARPYRAWGYPWTTGFALAGSLAFLAGAIAGDTRNSLWALVVLAASYPIYRVSKMLNPAAN
ncbi:MAG TPA: APC family permease [Candidatus Acidoferrales bacterium]|nr:APC family permease [Candidatus Acidoferrales bacterium]